jgi:hypothetical protein
VLARGEVTTLLPPSQPSPFHLCFTAIAPCSHHLLALLPHPNTTPWLEPLLIPPEQSTIVAVLPPERRQSSVTTRSGLCRRAPTPGVCKPLARGRLVRAPSSGAVRERSSAPGGGGGGRRPPRPCGRGPPPPGELRRELDLRLKGVLRHLLCLRPLWRDLTATSSASARGGGIQRPASLLGSPRRCSLLGSLRRCSQGLRRPEWGPAPPRASAVVGRGVSSAAVGRGVSSAVVVNEGDGKQGDGPSKPA